MRVRAAGWALAAVFALACPAIAQAPAPSSRAATCAELSVNEVVGRLERRNRERAQALLEFQGTRVYRMEYRGLPSDKDAEMTVGVTYQSPDKKDFIVLSETGSKFIVNHVLKKLLESEREAADPENQRRTALTKENYDFAMDHCENAALGPQYVLDVTPKSKNKFLYRGKIWVDARDYAVTQIKAEPAKNPSFWIRETSIEHKYVKVDDFWLPAENHSESNIRLGGRATLTIEYKDYKVMAASARENKTSESPPCSHAASLNTKREPPCGCCARVKGEETGIYQGGGSPSSMESP